MNQLAVSWRAQGRYDEADRAYREALTVYEAANGPDDPKVAVALSNLGDILRRRGREHAAEPVYRRAARIAEGAGDDELLAQCRTNLGWHLRMTGRSPEGDPSFAAPTCWWRACVCLRGHPEAMSQTVADFLLDDGRAAEAPGRGGNGSVAADRRGGGPSRGRPASDPDPV